MHPIRTLALGPGPGPRLLSPGMPDALFADGAHVGWLGLAGVFSLRDGVVHYAPIGPVAALVAAPGAWMAFLDAGPATEVVVVDPAGGPARPRARLNCPARRLVPGGAWCVVRMGTEHVAVDLDGGEAPLPMGARRRWPVPWPDQAGVAWVDEGTVFRLAAGSPPRVAGSVKGLLTALLVGPGGALVVETDEGTWGAAPQGPLHHIDAAAEGARFHPEGGSVLLRTADGAGAFDLRPGRLLSSLSGALSPVGFAPGALLLDEETGDVVELDGRPVLRGFVPAAPALGSRRLYGPGATAWDLATGAPAWSAPPLAAEHLVLAGDRVVCVEGDAVSVLEDDGTERGRFRLPAGVLDGDGSVWACAWIDGALIVEGPEGAAAFDLEGRLLPFEGTLPADPDPLPCPALDLAADGWTRAGGALWAWTDDGALFRLPDEGPTPP